MQYKLLKSLFKRLKLLPAGNVCKPLVLIMIRWCVRQHLMVCQYVNLHNYYGCSPHLLLDR